MKVFSQGFFAPGTSGHQNPLLAEQRQIGRCRLWKCSITPRAVLVLEPLAATSSDKGVLQPELPASQIQDASIIGYNTRQQSHRPSNQSVPVDLSQGRELKQPDLQPPSQQTPITPRHHGKQRHLQEQPPNQPKRAHTHRRDPRALLQSIQAAGTLKQLQQALYHGSQWLNAAHVSAILNKAKQFASADPREWFPPAAEQYRTAQQQTATWTAPSDSRQPPHDRQSQDEDGLHIPDAHSDWGMSDEGEGGHPGPSGRPSPSFVLPIDPAMQHAAFRQLLSIIDRAASLAVRLASHEQLGHTHASAILEALANLGYRNQPVLSKVLRECMEGRGNPTPRTLMRCVWACAMLKMDPGQEWLRAWEEAMLKCMGCCTFREVCTSLCALGSLDHRPTSTFMAAACSRSLKLISKCRAFDLANLSEGLAKLGYVPDATWTSTFLSASGKRLRQFSIQDLQRTLASLAILECRPEQEWLDGFYARCQELLLSNNHIQNSQPFSAALHQHGNVGLHGSLTTKQMASMATALARLGLRPDMKWMDVCLGQTRHEFPQASPQDLSQLIGALATLRYRPSESWMQGYLMVCFQQLAMYTPEQAVSQLRSLVRLGQRPSSIWLNELTRKTQAQLHDYTGNQLAALLSSLARLHHRPSPGWLSDWEVASQGQLDQFSADSLASSVWALAHLKHQPAVGWLYSFVLAAYSRLDAFGAVQLGMVFEALPRVSPHPGWLDELVQICASESSPVAGRGLSSMSIDELDELPDTSSPTLTTSITTQTQDTDTPTSSYDADDSPQKATGLNGNGGSRLWMQMPSARDLAAGVESVASPVTLRTYDGGDVLVGDGDWVATGGKAGHAGAYEVRGLALDGNSLGQGLGVVQVMGLGLDNINGTSSYTVNGQHGAGLNGANLNGATQNGWTQNDVHKHLPGQASQAVVLSSEEHGVALPLTHMASATCQTASGRR